MDPQGLVFDITCDDIPDLAPVSHTFNLQLDSDVAQIHEYAFREPFIQGPAYSARWLASGVTLTNVFRYPDTSSVAVHAGETQAFLIQPAKDVPLVGDDVHGATNSLALLSSMSASQHIVTQAAQSDAPVLARIQIDKTSGRPLHVSILHVLSATIPSEPRASSSAVGAGHHRPVQGSRWKQGFTFLAKVVDTMPYAEYVRRVHDRYGDAQQTVHLRCPVDLSDMSPYDSDGHSRRKHGRLVQHSLPAMPAEARGTASAVAIPQHVWRRYDPVRASLRAWDMCEALGLLPAGASGQKNNGSHPSRAPWADTGLVETTEEWINWVCRHASALSYHSMGRTGFVPAERRVEYVSEDEDEGGEEEEEEATDEEGEAEDEGGGAQEAEDDSEDHSESVDDDGADGFETASGGDSPREEGGHVGVAPSPVESNTAQQQQQEATCHGLTEDTVPMCMSLQLLHPSRKPLPLRIHAALRTLSRFDGLLCAHCGVQVCTKSAMLPLPAAGLSGSALRFINPAGMSFRVITVSEAAMLRPLSIQGSPCPDASWFNGYGWSFLQCKGCEQHIGWRYDWIGDVGESESAGLSRAQLDSVEWDGAVCDMILLPSVSWSMEDDNEWRHALATMPAAEQAVLRARHDAVMSRLESSIGSSLVHRLLEDGVPLAWLWRHRRILPWPTVAVAVQGERQGEHRGADTAQAPSVPTLRSIVGPPPPRGATRGMPSAFYGLIAGSVTAKLA